MTIQDDVVIGFGPGTGLGTIGGRVDIQGTDAIDGPTEVRLTSMSPDPQPGDWLGVSLSMGSSPENSPTISGLVVECAGQQGAVALRMSNQGTITHSSIRDNLHGGVQFLGSNTASVTAELTDSEVVRNGDYGVRVERTGAPRIAGVSIRDNGGPAAMAETRGLNAFQGNSVSGNNPDALVRFQVQADTLSLVVNNWVEDGMPLDLTGAPFNLGSNIEDFYCCRPSPAPRAWPGPEGCDRDPRLREHDLVRGNSHLPQRACGIDRVCVTFLHVRLGVIGCPQGRLLSEFPVETSVEAMRIPEQPTFINRIIHPLVPQRAPPWRHNRRGAPAQLADRRCVPVELEHPTCTRCHPIGENEHGTRRRPRARLADEEQQVVVLDLLNDQHI